MPNKPATRALAVGSSLMVLVIGALCVVALIAWNNTARLNRDAELIRLMCQNNVLAAKDLIDVSKDPRLIAHETAAQKAQRVQGSEIYLNRVRQRNAKCLADETSK